MSSRFFRFFRFFLAGLAGLAALGLSSCRPRQDPTPASETADASMQKPLPLGMLGTSALPSLSDAGAPAGIARRLRTSRERGTAAGIVELYPAAPGDTPTRTTFEHLKGGSLYLPLDAMTLLHESFARAMPGFDTFVPQLLDAVALGRLRAELVRFGKLWMEAPSAASARERWPLSPLVRELSGDAEWQEARTALAATLDEIAHLSIAQESAGAGLWVLMAR